MRLLLAAVVAAFAVLPGEGAWACPPAMPGSVPPSDEERLEEFVRGSTDILYGVVTRTAAAAGEPVSLQVLHVYKGGRQKGETIDAVVDWDYPVPFCAGMMRPPPTKPVGAYGVVAFSDDRPALVFFKPQDVQAMIDRDLITSARAR